MAKECRAEKKKRETRTCFKCKKKGHIAKNCKEKQTMKKHKIQEEESDGEDKDDKEQCYSTNVWTDFGLRLGLGQ